MRFWRLGIAATVVLLGGCGGEVAVDPGQGDEPPPATDETEAVATTEDAAPEEPTEVEEPGKATPTGTLSVTLPTGKTVEAETFKDPAPGTVEQSIIESMKLIGAGDFETWMSTWCHETYCGDAKQRESLTSYNLPAAKGTSGQCLQEGDTIVVTRREISVDDGSVRIYVYCGDSRMPAPSSHLPDGEVWKVTSLSW